MSRRRIGALRYLRAIGCTSRRIHLCMAATIWQLRIGAGVKVMRGFEPMASSLTGAASPQALRRIGEIGWTITSRPRSKAAQRVRASNRAALPHLVRVDRRSVRRGLAALFPVVPGCFFAVSCFADICGLLLRVGAVICFAARADRAAVPVVNRAQQMARVVEVITAFGRKSSVLVIGRKFRNFWRNQYKLRRNESVDRSCTIARLLYRLQSQEYVKI